MPPSGGIFYCDFFLKILTENRPAANITAAIHTMIQIMLDRSSSFCTSPDAGPVVGLVALVGLVGSVALVVSIGLVGAVGVSLLLSSISV